MADRRTKTSKVSDEPAYFTVGTEVSARFKGAFCEARIKAVDLSVICKLTYCEESIELDSQCLRGDICVGASVEFLDSETQETRTGVIVSIKDNSVYTVDFDGGDERMLRRSQLCLKGKRYFAQTESLNSMPLTSPEEFCSPVRLASSRSTRSLRHHQRHTERVSKKKKKQSNSSRDASSSEGATDSSSRQCSDRASETSASTGTAVAGSTADFSKSVGDVVNVVDRSRKSDLSGSKQLIYCPGLVVLATAYNGTVQPNCIAVCSFKTGRVQAVREENLREFCDDTRRVPGASYSKSAIKKALAYLESKELPPGWNRKSLLGPSTGQQSVAGDSSQEESDESDEEDMEMKNLFVAHLYKFMDERGTPINKCPTLGGRDLDLHALYRKVQDLGGYTRVCHKNLWKAVLDQLRSKLGPAVSVKSLKAAYVRYLSNFDVFIRKIGYSFASFGVSSSRTTDRSKTALLKELRKNNKLAMEKSAAGRSQTKQRRSSGKVDSSGGQTGSAVAVQEERKDDLDSAAKVSASDRKDEEAAPSTAAVDGADGSFKGIKVTIGQRVLVQYGSGSKKGAYKARVLQVLPKWRCLVHYSGWSNRYNEIVPFSKVLDVLDENGDPCKTERSDGEEEGRQRKRSSKDAERTSESGAEKTAADTEAPLRNSSKAKPNQDASSAKPTSGKRSAASETAYKRASKKLAGSLVKESTESAVACETETVTATSAEEEGGEEDLGEEEEEKETESVQEHASESVLPSETTQTKVTSTEETESMSSAEDTTEEEEPESAAPLPTPVADVDSSIKLSDSEREAPENDEEATKSSSDDRQKRVEATEAVVNAVVAQLVSEEAKVPSTAVCEETEELREEPVEAAATSSAPSSVVAQREPTTWYVRSSAVSRPKDIMFANGSSATIVRRTGLIDEGASNYGRPNGMSASSEELPGSSAGSPFPSRPSDELDLASLSIHILECEVMAEMQISNCSAEDDPQCSVPHELPVDLNSKISSLEQALSNVKKEYMIAQENLLKLERRRRWTLGRKTPGTEHSSSDATLDSPAKS